MYTLYRHLPLYLVAAFAKKLAQLALSASATGKDVFQMQCTWVMWILGLLHANLVSDMMWNRQCLLSTSSSYHK